MATKSLFNPSSVSQRRVVDTQDFVAVILVGYGESLYPFNEGTNVASKALMPVGNVPIVNLVLDWVIDAGLTDILMIVPPAFYSAISNHLAENYSSSAYPKLRIDLKRHTDGEKDEDELASESTQEAKGAGVREGTARLLRRFRSSIKSDFVLLPCDVSPPPGLKLASILDKHRAAPDSVLTSLFYEPVEAVKEDEESFLVGYDEHTDELLLAEPLEGMEEELATRMELMCAHPGLSFSTKLLDAHIYIMRRTVLDLLATRRPRDLASIKEQVVPWLIKGAWQGELSERWASILSPPRRDIFAAALARSTAAPPSAVTKALAADDGASSPSSDPQGSFPPTVPATPAFPAESSKAYGTLTAANVTAAGLGGRQTRKSSSRRRHVDWKCQAVVIAPEPVPAASIQTQGKGKDKSKAAPAEPAYLIRANSLAGYWELNRRFLRSMPPNITVQAPPASPALPRGEDGSIPGPPISSSAQISPDSLLGEGTRVGDRASIKKCVVGRHCNIGRGAKLTGCVLWDFVTVEENARIENAILCSNVRIGEKAAIKDCEFGTGFEAMPGAVLKVERLVAGQEA